MSSRSPPDSLRVVAISPNLAGSAPPGMNGEFSRLTIISSPETSSAPPPGDPTSVAFVKGGKRKRLSKACDACHKSKRRCDGTAPCSNCYFASKECTYTDSSGRPVPAPRVSTQDRSIPPSQIAPRNVAVATPFVAETARTSITHSTSVTGVRRQTDVPDTAAKRARPEALSTSSSGSIASSPSLDSGNSSPTTLLDPATTHELTNLFFAHCNPHRLILHKPSFSAALAHDKVPSYLVLAVCALAAPWSKDATTSAPMPRLAGVPFFQEAQSIMFDASGRLLSEPSLATAQALCLLEMHEVAASHSWTKHYRYFDLALQLLEEGLHVHRPDTPIPGLTSIEARQLTIDRECTRRCFWLIQCMSWINGIYTYRPMRPRCVELMRQVRLPVDETSFELGKTTTEPEFLHTPGPRTKTASQFGHVCRTLSMYQALETVIATKDAQSRPPALAACRDTLEQWVASLPDHLRFSEDNLEKQIVMFETSSNTGAWCYCFMHSLHPCFVLSLTEAEGRLAAEPVGWIRNQLNMIFKATGHRAKNTILSACTLWSYSKYYPDDPQVLEWDDSFEKLWGFRVTVVAAQWRKTQNEQRSQIGRTYPVDTAASQRESPPAFAVACSDSTPLTQAQTPRSQPSSSRSSPRENHSMPVDSRSTAHTPSSNGGHSQGGSPRNGHHHSQSQQYQQPPQQYGQAGATPTAPRDMSASAVMNSGQGPRPLQSQQSLPSLKASGLLETWKPPADGLQNGAIPRSDRPPSGIVNHPHALGQPSQNGARHPAAPLPAQNMAWTRFEGQ